MPTFARWLIGGLIAVTVMVAVGFYLQNFARNPKLLDRMDPTPAYRFKSGDIVELNEPIPVARETPLAVEARTMVRRKRWGEKDNKQRDIANADRWFELVAKDLKWATNVEILEVSGHLSRVHIRSDPDRGFEGYTYTLAIEEAARDSTDKADPKSSEK